VTDKFYIEVGELLARNLYTGIQRVVRQIARNIIEIGPENGLEVIPVVTIGSSVYPLNAAGRASLLDPPTVTYSLPTPSEQPLRKLIRPVLLGIPALYKALQTAYVSSKLKGLYTPERIQFSPSDYFVLLGSFWGGSSAIAAAHRVAKTGSSVVPVIYDLIPITHPQFCDVQNVRAFTQGFNDQLPSLTGIVTISQYCVAEIDAYLAGRGFTIPAAHFYLGADIATGSKGSADEEQSWPDGLLKAGGRTYVMVGTIEPRKGHRAVLDGFERRWAAGADDRLLIIGKVGWAVEDLMARFAGHPELGKRLFLVHTATDGMLNQAYGFAHAAIIASSVEGFGLPLVEALYKRLPVIASDIEVFREIAEDKVLYFKLDDPEDLARKIIHMNENAVAFRTLAAAFSWIDWRQSAAQFLASVKAVSVARRQAPPAWSGA
jgi:alpha-1,2-rhamnosyltransferase